MLNDIYNYLPISEHLATAGQPTAEQFATIRQAGFDLVVNLALPTSSNALPDERSVVEACGMTYSPIPVIWEHPTAADFEQFQATLASHPDQKIFVHCAMNMRVSAFVYLHQRLDGVPPSSRQPHKDLGSERNVAAIYRCHLGTSRYRPGLTATAIAIQQTVRAPVQNRVIPVLRITATHTSRLRLRSADVP